MTKNTTTSTGREREPSDSRRRPQLRFSPTAWAKLVYFCHRDDVEIGGFGVTSADDLLLVEEFATVKQEATMASIAFEDRSVAEFFEAQVEAGRKPEQFARIWCHTHPGDSPAPSRTDEETFARVFGGCDWAVMFVLARTGTMHACLRFNVGPGGEAVIPVEVDFTCPFGASDHEAWEAEYEANVHPTCRGPDRPRCLDDTEGIEGLSIPDEWLEDLEEMEPAERHFVLAGLAGREDPWCDETEAVHVDLEDG